ncbi:ASPIC/UnbV domain-containing protein, partial [Meiothermus taiwanensis]|uniref:ASPIC/UnbV domain-containing protein n=1 Tax=Meiothermus taiwanensis TaxID=172827 RepID=UPI000B2E6488
FCGASSRWAAHLSGGLGFVHFGLGPAERVRLRVRWPDGEQEGWLEAPSNRFVVLARGQGLLGYTPGRSY